MLQDICTNVIRCMVSCRW